jgi:hypothetical protein
MRLRPMRSLLAGKSGSPIADREATQDHVLGRDREVSAHDLADSRRSTPARRFLDRGQSMPGRSHCEDGGRNEHADAHAVDVVEIAVHADDPGKRRPEELPVAQHRFASVLDVIPGDAHRSVHLGAELAAEVRERVGRLWHFR